MGHQPYLTLEDLPSLKEAVQKATVEGTQEFEYQTHAGDIAPMYVPYALYVIQYLEKLKAEKEKHQS